MTPALDVGSLVLGIAILYWGAEWLIRGSAGIARALGVTPLVVGLTVVAYGTAAPELAVATKTALAGHTPIALGTVIGSCAANIALVLGLVALIAPPTIDGRIIRREIPVLVGSAIAVPILFRNGVLSRLDGLFLVGCAIVFTLATLTVAARLGGDHDDDDDDGNASAASSSALRAGAEAGGKARPRTSRVLSLVMTVGGLGLLVVGATFLVSGGRGIAQQLGMSERMLGLTIIALGTALPELIRAVVAAARGRASLAVKLGDRGQLAERVPRARHHRVPAADPARRAHAPRGSARPRRDHPARRARDARLAKDHAIRRRAARARVHRVLDLRGDPVMPVRDFALGIVLGDTLAAKLRAPDDELDLVDHEAPLRIATPGRPAELAIASARRVRTPPLVGMRDPRQRARILHALANHELQAIELFAWALLAYPDAPLAFRRGLVAILADEQIHFGLYTARLAALGTRFGDHPVTGHFWNQLAPLRGPLEFACAMNLTFEQANLDFAGDYATAARACGDLATAEALDRVHADEIRHVHFGWVWLRRFATGDPWQTYLAHVTPPLGPHRARGARLDCDARRRAGLDDAFIDALDAVAPTRPSGEPR